MVRRTPVTLALVLCTAAIFILGELMPPALQNWVLATFGLSVDGLRAGFWWQPVTHAFLHGGVFHLLFNVLALWFAGRMVERVVGGARLLALYLFSAIVGGLFQMFLSPGAPGLLIGSSGAVCGILMAFAMMFPDLQVTALLFFVIPLRLRAKILVWGLVAITVVFWATGWQSWIGHGAHLGGFVGGFVFTRLLGLGRPGIVPTWLQEKLRRDSV
jgi:membrane associated rhomboid family serine protease